MARTKAHRKPLHDQHVRDAAGRIHDRGFGLASWGERPIANHLPPPESLGVLHDFAPRLARAQRIDLELVGAAQQGHGLKTLLRVPTDEGDVMYFESRLALEADLRDRLRAPRGPLPQADAAPYFLLPKHPGDFWWSFGIRPLDVGALVYRDRVVFAVFADVGPPDRIGQASIEVHRELGLVAPLAVEVGFPGVVGASDAYVATIVFPRSGSQSGTTAEAVRKKGRELLRRVGGVAS